MCEEMHLPVIFMLTLQNTSGFNGVRLSGEFGLYENEADVVLEENF